VISRSVVRLHSTAPKFSALAAFRRDHCANHSERNVCGPTIGQNIVFEERFAEGKVEPLPVLAAKLVQLRVDLIVAGPAVATRAAHSATTTMPVVVTFSADDPSRAVS
jgi:hypothetical protein